MPGTCDGCLFAEWNRTKAGKLHPDGTGTCQRLAKHPLDLRLPAAFHWPTTPDIPKPRGGYIQRGADRGKCIFKSGQR